jgi:cation transport ATPase
MIEGATSADESALTGEAIPVVKQIGNPVSGGTLNLDGQQSFERPAAWRGARSIAFLG